MGSKNKGFSLCTHKMIQSLQSNHVKRGRSLKPIKEQQKQVNSLEIKRFFSYRYAWLLPIALLKILFFFFYFQFLVNTYWANQVYMDIWAWSSFWKQCQQGLLPYIDFSREYPHLAGFIFYLLSPLFQLDNPLQMLMSHALIMLAVDLLNSIVFIEILRQKKVRSLARPLLLFQFNLTALLLSPFRFESMLLFFILLGYLLFLKKRWYWATVVWTLGFHLKWFSAFLLAVQFVRLAREKHWRQAWATLGIFSVITTAILAPVLALTLSRGHSLRFFFAPYLFHVNRPLYWDTLLGVLGMWTGPLSFERWASLLSLLLMLLIIFIRPRLNMASKIVLISIAMLICNRVYSPQFHLWFYPFLILVWLQTSGTMRKKMGWTALALDLSNVLIYPFVYTYAYHEVAGFSYGVGLRKGGPLLVIFSLLIILRALLLGLLAYFTVADIKEKSRDDAALNSADMAGSGDKNLAFERF